MLLNSNAVGRASVQTQAIAQEWEFILEGGHGN